MIGKSKFPCNCLLHIIKPLKIVRGKDGTGCSRNGGASEKECGLP